MSRSFAFLRTTAGASLAGAIMLGLTAAPASADREVFRDARGDVVTSTFSEVDGETSGIDPTVTGTDALRTVVKHGDRRIKIKVRVRDLRAKDQGSMTAFLKTNEGFYLVTLMRTPLWGSTADIVDLDSDEEGVSCPGIQQSISAKKDRFLVSFPRSCVSRPRWIRAMVSMSEFEIIQGETENDFSFSSHDDDTRVAGDNPSPIGPGSRKAFGPRLYKG